MKTITTLPPFDITGPLSALRGLPSAARVDRDNKVIYSVALIQRGPLNEGDERPWFVDDTSLAQVLSLAKESPPGLKARWTHPNMSKDGLGSYLGRWRNPRLSDDGSTVLADLHLAGVAFSDDEDSRGDYVLDMAAEDPEAFGVSLYPRLDKAEMEKLQTLDGKQPMRFSALVAGDVVDEPAATRGGFFGGQLSIATAPAYATQALDSLFPEGTSADVIRERVSGFVSEYLAQRTPAPETLATESTGEINWADESADIKRKAALADELVAKRQRELASARSLAMSPMLAAGVELADFTPAEAAAFEPCRGFAMEYLADASVYCRDALSFSDYVDSRLTETKGAVVFGQHGLGGSRMQFSSTLASALAKQQAIVERTHPLLKNGMHYFG